MGSCLYQFFPTVEFDSFCVPMEQSVASPRRSTSAGARLQWHQQSVSSFQFSTAVCLFVSLLCFIETCGGLDIVNRIVSEYLYAEVREGLLFYHCSLFLVFLIFMTFSAPSRLYKMEKILTMGVYYSRAPNTLSSACVKPATGTCHPRAFELRASPQHDRRP